MPEQVQKILTKITDWWKKFTTKQRILLGSIVAVIILALVILAVVVGKPNMVTLIECSSTAQAGEVKDLLDNDGSISYQMSDDGLTFYVDEKDNAAASILLDRTACRRKDFPSIMYSAVDSAPPRQTRLRNTSCIWRIISQISWRHCQMSRVLL